MAKWLMVDDDPEDQEIFELALSDVDAEIELSFASNGCDALEKLKRSPEDSLPDLIFLDLNMSQMDGRECITELKKDPVFKKIPVIIYSTSSDSRDVSALKQLGADRFVTKPSDVVALTGILKEIAASYNSLH